MYKRQEECRQILKTEKRGVLSVIGDNGYPYGIPINFYYDENDGKIYFHCAKEGHKIDAIKNCDKACFTTVSYTHLIKALHQVRENVAAHLIVQLIRLYL